LAFAFIAVGSMKVFAYSLAQPVGSNRTLGDHVAGDRLSTSSQESPVPPAVLFFLAVLWCMGGLLS
jgi:hypothetical protein